MFLEAIIIMKNELFYNYVVFSVHHITIMFDHKFFNKMLLRKFVGVFSRKRSIHLSTY